MIVELPPDHGSVIRKFAIVYCASLSSSAASDLLGSCFSDVLIFAVGAAAVIFLERKDWATEVGLKRSTVEKDSRVEPRLPWPDLQGIAAGAGDNGVPREVLIDRTVQALEGLAHPVERGTAHQFDVSLNGEPLLSIGKRRPVYRSLLESDIADAIAAIHGHS